MLVAEQATARYFETVAAGRDAKAAANWVMGDLFGALNRLGLGIEQSPVSADQLGALIDLIADGTISGRIAKDVFAEMVETGADPAAIVETEGPAPGHRRGRDRRRDRRRARRPARQGRANTAPAATSSSASSSAR